MHYPSESGFEFVHSFRFLTEKVCRICRSRRFVLESFFSGSDSSSHRVYGVAYLAPAWLEKEKGGKKLSLFTFDFLLQALSTVVRNVDVTGSVTY